MNLDLEKFIDRVNHDHFVGAVAKRVGDVRLRRYLRAYLRAGRRASGARPTKGRRKQGGPLSPPLSNLVMDALDRELTRRGHRFVRYADDCNPGVGRRVCG